MLLVRTYIAYDLPIEDFEALPEIEAGLCTIRLQDEHGWVREQISYDEEEKPVTWEQQFFDAEGRLIASKDYGGESADLFFTCEYSYDDAGRLLHREKITGDVAAGTLNTYDDRGRLIIQTEYEGDVERKITRYFYSPDLPDCCIREEYSGPDAGPPRVLTREWKVESGKPVLIEEFLEYLFSPFDTRIYRFYDPRKTPNNVAVEVYNDQGNFIEETREIYDSSDRLIRQSKHADDAPESTPFFIYSAEYDHRGNLIGEMHAGERELVDPKRPRRGITFQSFSKYDAMNRETHRLTKQLHVSTLQLFKYQTVADDYRLIILS